MAMGGALPPSSREDFRSMQRQIVSRAGFVAGRRSIVRCVVCVSVKDGGEERGKEVTDFETPNYEFDMLVR